MPSKAPRHSWHSRQRGICNLQILMAFESSNPALDEPVPARIKPMPSAAGPEAVAAPATRLRDAVAAARITPGPAPSRTRFDEPDLQRRVLNWTRGQRVILSFDPQRPNYELR